MSLEDALPCVPEHMRGGLRRYVEDGIPPGGFLGYVLANKLCEATMTADDVNRQHLSDYGRMLMHLPIGCWGSQAAIDEWCQQGGMRGRSHG